MVFFELYSKSNYYIALSTIYTPNIDYGDIFVHKQKESLLPFE